MKTKKSSEILRISLLAAGILMIIAGGLLGEAGEIRAKAVKVCLECIGIG